MWPSKKCWSSDLEDAHWMSEMRSGLFMHELPRGLASELWTPQKFPPCCKNPSYRKTFTSFPSLLISKRRQGNILQTIIRFHWLFARCFDLFLEQNRVLTSIFRIIKHIQTKWDLTTDYFIYLFIILTPFLWHFGETLSCTRAARDVNKVIARCS